MLQMLRALLFPGTSDPDLENHLDDQAFFFMKNKNYCLSLIWRKHIPDMSGVHAIGCKSERRHQKAGKNKTLRGKIIRKRVRNLKKQIKNFKKQIKEKRSKN